MQISVKNWRGFRHLEDGSPPWIRLHRKLLERYDFHQLPVESRALAPMLWLLASEHPDGVIKASADELGFRLRQDRDQIVSALLPLVDAGFFLLERDPGEMLIDRLRKGPEAKLKELEASQERIEIAKRVIEFLNKRTGKRYKPLAVNVEFIVARLKEGATEQECKQIIANRWLAWKDDDQMRDFLRPATLFNRTRFAQYQGELRQVETEDEHRMPGV